MRHPLTKRKAIEALEHQWWFWQGIECCKVCGIVWRRDDMNKPCRGPVRIKLRARENGHLYVLLGTGEIYRRICDEKGNFDGEWEEVTGPWRTL